MKQRNPGLSGGDMFNPKRLTVAVFFGFITGWSCWMVGTHVFGNSYDIVQITNIFVNRMLIGFVIGISALKMNWYSHGLLMGSVVGLPFLLYDYIAGYGLIVVISVAIVNPLYGLAIEFFTSKIFKLESQTP